MVRLGTQNGEKLEGKGLKRAVAECLVGTMLTTEYTEYTSRETYIYIPCIRCIPWFENMQIISRCDLHLLGEGVIFIMPNKYGGFMSFRPINCSFQVKKKGPE